MEFVPRSLSRTSLVGIITAVMLVALAWAPRASAQEPEPLLGVDISHRLGVGFSFSEAPLGFRYFWSRRYGVDAGLGLRSDDFASFRQTTVVLDGAFLYALAPGERVNAFLRLGTQFRNVDRPAGSTSTVQFSGALEYEVFLNNSIGILARAGVFLDLTSPPSGNDRASFGTRSGMLTSAGIHYYFEEQTDSPSQDHE